MRMTEKNPHALGGHKLSSGLPRPTVCDSPQDSQVSGAGGLRAANGNSKACLRQTADVSVVSRWHAVQSNSESAVADSLLTQPDPSLRLPHDTLNFAPQDSPAFVIISIFRRLLE